MSTEGFSGLVVVAVDVVEDIDMGVSPPQPWGVSPPFPYGPAVGVILVPLRPRSLLPSGPGVMTSVSFLPAAAIHSESCESSAFRYSCWDSVSIKPGKKSLAMM